MLTSNLFYRIPALLIALTFHEAAHGYVAYRLGDPTARAHGRLSLNPLAHLDPLGLLSLWLVGFGWAKPVPVNPYYFRGDRSRGMFLVGLAGPVSNFLLAFLFLLLFAAVPAIRSVPHLGIIIYTTYVYNLLLGVFNLLPVPPLDGSKVLAYFLPRQAMHTFSQLERYGPLLLVLLIFSGTLWRVLNPFLNLVESVIVMLVRLITGT